LKEQHETRGRQKSGNMKLIRGVDESMEKRGDGRVGGGVEKHVVYSEGNRLKKKISTYLSYGPQAARENPWGLTIPKKRGSH